MFKDKKWETDAGNISNYETFNRFVYRNGAVNSFLHDNGKFFIIAAKGMGKTLLLSYKRYLLEEQYKYNGVVFIPSHHPYISFIESIKTTLSQDHINSFKDWEYCKRVWALIIELSILSYLNFNIDEFLENASPKTKYFSKILDNILKSNHSVEYIFNEIISMSETTLLLFVEDVSNSINEEFKNINQSVIMFFDRLDNALETAHDSIWQPLQAGLLEAAWDVMRSNSHVKIYLSIRQEAYAKHDSRNKSAISSSVVKIEYSREELKQLLNHLVKFYEDKRSLEEFLGFKSFQNTIVFEEEDIYDFMYRYSIGRPRDFVQFCDELSKSKDAVFENFDDKRMFLKDKVRSISSKVIISSLFEELRMLLKCLTISYRFNDFLKHLENNILTYSDMQFICSKFNKIDCNKNCVKCSSEYHPFCDLYNMGLLGIINTEHGKKIQHFKTPYENMTHGLRNDSDYFLVHPALREYVNELHMSSPLGIGYKLFMGILVGEGLLWNEKYDNLVKVNKLISQVKNEASRKFFYDTLKKFTTSRRFKFSEKSYEKIDDKPYYPYEQRLNESIVNFFKTKTLIEPKKISIFISYACNDNDHKSRVESFVNMLRDMGFDAHMDSSLKEDYPDIDEMMTVGLSMDKVIIILSEEYKKRADNQVGGVWKEFKMIADDLEQNSKKYIFVSFDAYSLELKNKISPKRIGNRWIVDLSKDKLKDYNELISFIKEEKEYPFKKPNEKVASVKPKEIKPFK